jgi:hypothetical protein
LKDHSESRLIDRRQEPTHFLRASTIGSFWRSGQRTK